MTEYSRMAKGYSDILETSGGCAPVNLPFQPDAVEFWNYGAFDTPTDTFVTNGYWDVNMGQDAAVFNLFNATPVLTSNATLTGGIKTFAAGQLLQYGARIQVASITKASPAVVTAGANHNLVSGDVVVFQGLYQSATTGMQQIAEIPFTVTVTGATTFTIPWNTNQSAYTAISGSPSGAYFKKVLYPYLYAPGHNVISAIAVDTPSTGLYTIDTTSAHNFVVGQEVAFRIPTLWGSIELNSLPNDGTPGSPFYGYVVSVTDYNTVVVDMRRTLAVTAFFSNIPFLSFKGLTFAQIMAVGDVNTGGVQISVDSQLYPPPFIRPIANTLVNTINGPAIQGAYFNNTSQGFIIGNVIAPAAQSGQRIFWRAFLHDMSVPK